MSHPARDRILERLIPLSREYERLNRHRRRMDEVLRALDQLEPLVTASLPESIATTPPGSTAPAAAPQSSNASSTVGVDSAFQLRRDRSQQLSLEASRRNQLLHWVDTVRQRKGQWLRSSSVIKAPKK